jgi:hypothetical protein
MVDSCFASVVTGEAPPFHRAAAELGADDRSSTNDLANRVRRDNRLGSFGSNRTESPLGEYRKNADGEQTEHDLTVAQTAATQPLGRFLGIA